MTHFIEFYADDELITHMKVAISCLGFQTFCIDQKESQWHIPKELAAPLIESSLVNADNMLNFFSTLHHTGQGKEFKTGGYFIAGQNSKGFVLEDDLTLYFDDFLQSFKNPQQDYTQTNVFCEITADVADSITEAAKYILALVAVLEEDKALAEQIQTIEFTPQTLGFFVANAIDFFTDILGTAEDIQLAKSSCYRFMLDTEADTKEVYEKIFNLIEQVEDSATSDEAILELLDQLAQKHPELMVTAEIDPEIFYFHLEVPSKEDIYYAS